MVGKEGKVVGLDINPTMLKVARALNVPAGASIEWWEGSALDLPDGPFNLVLCQQGLQFFADRAAAVREMRRVLAVGGRAALSVWQELKHHPVYEAFAESAARHLGVPASALTLAFSMGDAEELRALFNAAGFQCVKIIAESLIVRFPLPERFVSLAVLAIAAVLPTFAQLDTAARSALVETVRQETETTLRRYIEGDSVAFPTSAYIAIAYNE